MQSHEIMDLVIRIVLIAMGVHFYNKGKKDRDAEVKSPNLFSPTAMMAIGVFMIIANLILLFIGVL